MKPEVERAWAAWDLRRYDEALALAGKVVAADPEDADGHFLLAKCLEQAGKRDEALAALGRSIALAPHWARPHLLRSDILEEEKRLDEALAAADEALRLDPALAAAHSSRAIRLTAMERTDEAVAAADEGVRLAPDHAGILSIRGWVVLDRDPAEALRYFERSAALDPQRADTLNDMGVAFQKLGRKEEAALAFRSAIMLDPTLKHAKSNAHAAVGKILGGTLLGGFVAFRGCKAAYVMGKSVVILGKMGIAVGLAIVAGMLALSVLVALGIRRHRRDKLRKRHPELVQLYEQLERDKKAGRI